MSRTGCDDYVNDAGDLRVGESPEHARIDADNFDEEARDAAEKQVDAEKFADVGFVIQPATADPPENPENYDGGEKFVDRRGMHFLSGGDNSIGETHAPGQRRWNAVIAVTGDEAADAAESVADCSGGRGDIEHLENGNFVVTGDENQRDCSGQGRAGEGESHGAE